MKPSTRVTLLGCYNVAITLDTIAMLELRLEKPKVNIDLLEIFRYGTKQGLFIETGNVNKFISRLPRTTYDI